MTLIFPDTDETPSCLSSIPVQVRQYRVNVYSSTSKTPSCLSSIPVQVKHYRVNVYVDTGGTLACPSYVKKRLRCTAISFANADTVATPSYRYWCCTVISVQMRHRGIVTGET